MLAAYLHAAAEEGCSEAEGGEEEGGEEEGGQEEGGQEEGGEEEGEEEGGEGEGEEEGGEGEGEEEGGEGEGEEEGGEGEGEEVEDGEEEEEGEEAGSGEEEAESSEEEAGSEWSSDGGDDEAWEEVALVKAEQLRGLLRPLDPWDGAVHDDDEFEIDRLLTRRVPWRRKAAILVSVIAYVNDLELEGLATYAPDESQQSTESQLEAEMLDDEDRSQTPQWTRPTRSGHPREPASLERMRAAPGAFGSPLVPGRVDGFPQLQPTRRGAAPRTGTASSSCEHAAPAAAARRAGRPAQLTADGHAAQATLKGVSEIAHKAPDKARLLLEEQRAVAPEPNLHPTIVAKSKAVTGAIFEASGGLNETIEVVAHLLQRAEMRPILEHLGYTQGASACDGLIVRSIADFVDKHLSSRGTRSTEAQAAFELLGKAAGSAELKEEHLFTEGARRLGIRAATFGHLIDCRAKMDAELEDGIEMGGLLKVSRLKRKGARDDDAQLWDNWSHRICRYDSTQTTGGKKVRRFDDKKVDGRVTFEEHERRTLPGSRVELCQRFLESNEYKAFLARKKAEAEAAAAAAVAVAKEAEAVAKEAEAAAAVAVAKEAETAATAAAAPASAPAAKAAKVAAKVAKAAAKAVATATAEAAKAGEPLNISYFQHRVCSCMVDEKMTQCADSIDTQFNVLFATWKKHVHDWFKTDTCSEEGCVCKEAGFFDIKSQKDLWAFLFRGECAPKPDPTRRLPHDVGEHTQLAHPCVVAECDEKGCLKDKLERWKSCPVQNKKGSETEVKSKKCTCERLEPGRIAPAPAPSVWHLRTACLIRARAGTPVPRGKAKAVADDDGDGDYDPDADKAEKWSKEMLPFECSRPDFMSLHLDSMQVATPRLACMMRLACMR